MTPYKRLVCILLLTAACLSNTATYADNRSGLIKRSDYVGREDVHAFMTDLVKRHDFEMAELRRLFAGAQQQASVLEAISRPAEGKPWHEYRKIFLTKKRINGGVKFWDEHQDLLKKAEEVYGVPPEIIVAIIGVETFYGKHAGRYPVLDTLITLGFDYPPRSKFFRSELEHFLLLMREEQLDPVSLQGSYAGAMGKGQFISSSYRRYAIDFDEDGKRDLWQTDDAIGSVAHYFKRHGWTPGAQVVLQAKIRGESYKNLIKKGLKPSIESASLKHSGVLPRHGVIDEAKISLLEFELEKGHEYWLAMNNFYVITRYNHSQLYGMAVYQLSQEIKEKRAQALADKGE